MKHLTKSQIEDLLFEESIPNSDQDEAYSHIKKCALCQEQFTAVWQFQRGVYQALEQSPTQHDKDFAKHISIANKITSIYAEDYFRQNHRIVFKVAAVILALLLGGATYFFYLSTKQQQETLVTQRSLDQLLVVDTTIKKDEKVLLAEFFDESEHFEDLIETEFRSHSTTIVSPGKGEIVKQPILLKWLGKRERVHIKVYTNKEQIVLSASTDADSILISKKLPLGLFYWTITSESELLSAGKFVVKN